MPQLAQGRPPESEKVVKFTTFSGSAATARHVGGMFGVGEKTVRNAAEFAEGVITVPSVPTVPPLAPPAIVGLWGKTYPRVGV
jgi:hypothetical protein